MLSACSYMPVHPVFPITEPFALHFVCSLVLKRVSKGQNHQMHLPLSKARLVLQTFYFFFFCLNTHKPTPTMAGVCGGWGGRLMYSPGCWVLGLLKEDWRSLTLSSVTFPPLRHTWCPSFSLLFPLHLLKCLKNAQSTVTSSLERRFPPKD